MPLRKLPRPLATELSHDAARWGTGDLTWRGVSEDGRLTFSLKRLHEGLHIDRSLNRPDGRRLTQSVFFVDESTFGHWCDSDHMRLQQVHICSVVRRIGLELFAHDPAHADDQHRLRFG